MPRKLLESRRVLIPLDAVLLHTIKTVGNKTMLPITIIKPIDCSENQLQEIYELILSGSQIPKEHIKKGIRRSKTLAYVLDNNRIVAIASIKKPIESYKSKVFKLASVSNLSNKFQFEIGYAVTSEKYRGQGIGQTLLDTLIKSSSTTGYFATTKNDSMRRILERLGFSKTGKNYFNDIDEELSLYTYDLK